MGVLPGTPITDHYLAEVAELADAHGSGPCTRKGVGVRVPSSAPSIGSFAQTQKSMHSIGRKFRFTAQLKFVSHFRSFSVRYRSNILLYTAVLFSK